MSIIGLESALALIGLEASGEHFTAGGGSGVKDYEKKERTKERTINDAIKHHTNMAIQHSKHSVAQMREGNFSGGSAHAHAAALHSKAAFSFASEAKDRTSAGKKADSFLKR